MRIGVIRWADLWRETKPNGEMLINASNANFNSFLETDSNLERLGVEKTQTNAKKDDYQWLGWAEFDPKTGRMTMLSQGYVKRSSTEIRVDVLAMEAVLSNSNQSATNSQISLKHKNYTLKEMLAQIGVEL